MISQNVRINLNAFFTRLKAHFEPSCVPGDNVVDAAELISNELKFPHRWLKSNNISINAVSKEYMLFS